VGPHLVACNGELLLEVFRLGSHPSLAEVYKIEWTLDLHVELHERVMDLGDCSLFVGRGDTFALFANEFPSIKRNCIYYVDKPYNQKYLISVFHLESNVLNCMHQPIQPKILN
jgi:hypothetical protein